MLSCLLTKSNLLQLTLNEHRRCWPWSLFFLGSFCWTLTWRVFSPFLGFLLLLPFIYLFTLYFGEINLLLLFWETPGPDWFWLVPDFGLFPLVSATAKQNFFLRCPLYSTACPESTPASQPYNHRTTESFVLED